MEKLTTTTFLRMRQMLIKSFQAILVTDFACVSSGNGGAEGRRIRSSRVRATRVRVIVRLSVSVKLEVLIE